MSGMQGILIIDKPPGFTSHDVVARVRHILHERRIGHTGTLDPFATGVLVLLIGRVTRLAQFFSDADKEYEAIIRLGFATDTSDRTGSRLPDAVGQIHNVGLWSEQEIENALASLRGYIDQVPPMFSAKKRGGRKLYELARRGEEVEREPVRVCIHEIQPIKPGGKLVKDNLDGTFDLQVRVVCSAGTYVRTLAEDFGKRLGIAAHLAELRRTRVGEFHISNAVSLNELSTGMEEEALGTLLVPPNAALPHMPLVHLTADDERRARYGLEVRITQSSWPDGAKVKMCDMQDQLIAVGEFDAHSGSLHPRVVIAAAS
ncbi:MAG: tRNA pseudouridine(55) synthase TruB [Pyrinomonadaceae bacterium]